MELNKTKFNITISILGGWLIILSAIILVLLLRKEEKPTPESLGFYPITVTEQQELDTISNISGNSEEAVLQEIIDKEEITVQNDGNKMLIFAKAITTDIFVPDTISLAGEEAPLYRLDIRESLTRELCANTYLHASTLQILRVFPRVSSQIIPILEEEGVPTDFVYLAVCESALNILALSPSKAAGLWQFLEGTGKEYGLEINNNIDERYHLEESTRAACRYLKKAYNRFGSWTLAAASYNCGMGAISKFQNNQHIKSYYDMLLSEETNRYVFRIMALKQIINNPEKYNFQLDQAYPAEPFKTIKVTTKIKDLAEWALEHGITYKTLKRFNPWLRQNELKVGNKDYYEIKIPINKKQYR